MKDKPMNDGPERIFLAPECCADPHEGRLWCEDDVWTGECEDGKRGIEYIRADKLEAARPLADGDMVERLAEYLAQLYHHKPLAEIGEQTADACRKQAAEFVEASGAERERAIRAAGNLAYGLLWHMKIDGRDPNLCLASKARTALLLEMTKDDQADGLTRAREALR